MRGHFRYNVAGGEGASADASSGGSRVSVGLIELCIGFDYEVK